MAENKFTDIERKAATEAVLEAELGERWRSYRREWTACEAMEVERAFPVHMDLEINNQCNLRCTMCDHGFEVKDPYYLTPQSLSLERFRKIVTEGAAKGLRSINFNGVNEPLLVKDLEGYIRLARDLGVVDLFLHTNATALTANRSRSLIEAGLTRIMFSIDGYSDETYAKIRVGGRFRQVLGNIEGFLRIRKEMGRRLPVTAVTFVQMSANEHELKDFRAFWEPRVDTVVVQKLIREPGKQHGSATAKDISFRCRMPWTRLTVMADGTIKPCCVLFNKKLTLGDIDGGTLEQAWTSPLMRRLRAVHKAGEWDAIPSCRDCTLATFT